MARVIAPDHLMNAALKLFAPRGYEATTVGAIETEAGMAPRYGALFGLAVAARHGSTTAAAG